MTRPKPWIMLPLAMTALGAWAADLPPSLAEIPIADTRVVVPSDFPEAAALAARGGTPVEIALRIAGPFEGATQQLIQVNAGSEAPAATRVTVLRDGLLDDAIRSERWDIALAKGVAGQWEIRKVERAWRCRRGQLPDRFSTTRCP